MGVSEMFGNIVIVAIVDVAAGLAGVIAVVIICCCLKKKKKCCWRQPRGLAEQHPLHYVENTSVAEDHCKEHMKKRTQRARRQKTKEYRRLLWDPSEVDCDVRGNLGLATSLSQTETPHLFLWRGQEKTAEGLLAFTRNLAVTNDTQGSLLANWGFLWHIQYCILGYLQGFLWHILYCFLLALSYCRNNHTSQ